MFTIQSFHTIKQNQSKGTSLMSRNKKVSLISWVFCFFLWGLSSEIGFAHQDEAQKHTQEIEERQKKIQEIIQKIQKNQKQP